jgi:hypothetical protein
MPSMVKCRNCGSEFASRGISFGNTEALETSKLSNISIEEHCPKCNQITVITDKSDYILRD